MSTWITAILFVALMAMIATAFMTLVRLTLGPSIMDRAVASDVLAVAAAGITLVLAVRTDRTDVLVLAIMFSMVGFMYSVTLGRFSERPRDTTDSPATPEQLRAQEVRLMREAQSELHAEEREAIKAAREAQVSKQSAKSVADAGERAKQASKKASKMASEKHE